MGDMVPLSSRGVQEGAVALEKGRQAWGAEPGQGLGSERGKLKGWGPRHWWMVVWDVSDTPISGGRGLGVSH